MAIEFSTATFETVQNLVYPLVLALTDFDAKGYVGEKSEVFQLTGEAFAEISKLFLTAATALEDGLLTAVEIDEIIAQALTIPAAVHDIEAFFKPVAEPVDPV